LRISGKPFVTHIGEGFGRQLGIRCRAASSGKAAATNRLFKAMTDAELRAHYSRQEAEAATQWVLGISVSPKIIVALFVVSLTRPQFATAKAWAESAHADPCDFKIEPNGIRVALDSVL
jgi:hypothetical protein